MLLCWRRRTTARAGLERVFVVVAANHFTAFFLRTNGTTRDPFVLDDFVKRGALFGINLQHSANDMPTFSWQESEKAPGTLDHLRCLLATGCRRGMFVLIACCCLWTWMTGCELSLRARSAMVIACGGDEI